MPEWTKVDDGEYNEQVAIINGTRVVLYSDRDGERWSCTLDAREPIDLDATGESAARREADRHARGV